MKTIERQAPPESQGINLRELWLIVLKRKRVVIVATVAGLALAALITLLTATTYTAVGQLLIEREPNILSFQDVFQIETFNDDYYQTQYKLLQSRSLAVATIDRMGSFENKDLVKAAFKKKRQSADLKAEPNAKRQLVGWFLKRLEIQPVRKTRLVRASFSDRSPKLSAEALNAFFEAYVDMNVQRKYQATEQATNFLASQIATVQSEIESNEAKLQQYGQEKNIVALSNSENTVITKLGELNRALTDAQIDRVNKETYYNEIRMATPDYIPNALSGTLVQRLAEEYNRLYRDYVKRSETFLPDYPEVRSLKAELDQAKKALEDETQAQINRAYTDFQAALSREQALSGMFGTQRREAFQLNSNAIQYNSLLIQIQNAKNLLETLMTRKSETDVSSRLKGLRTSNIWIVDKAEVPLEPSRPEKAKNLALGLVMGLFIGLALAILFENLDVTVKTPEDIKKSVGMSVLGLVPAYQKNGRTGDNGGVPPDDERRLDEKDRPAWLRDQDSGRISPGLKGSRLKDADQRSMDLITHFSPESSFAEHFRSIRTALMFSMADSKIKAVGVTSALPQEGKTAVTCNLAVTLAQAGKRVVIMDMDLRRPRLHKIFRVKNLNGLTKYLAADLAIEDLPRPTPIPKLFLVNSGPIPPNPLELLGSEKLTPLISRLKKSFDFILVDTPPVLSVSDSLAIGPSLDGTLLVVRADRTPRQALKLVSERIDEHKIKCLGIILNSIRLEDLSDYHYGAYYDYGERTGA